MKAEFVSAGLAVDYTPDAAVTAGDVIALGTGRVGIAVNDIAAGALGSLAVTGVFKVQKINAQLNQWALVYWDEDGNPYNRTAGTGCLTGVSGGNIPAGIMLATAAATDETGTILLFAAPAITATILESLSAAIADPGDGGAIPVATSGNVQIVTAGAETRTLAIPTFVGQILLLQMKTDGGDAVITVASAIDEAGHLTITLDDVGDYVLLVGVQAGAAKAWRVAASMGVDWTIADPGNAGAIPVLSSGQCPLTSGAQAETRTLANPTHADQVLTIVHSVDGGGNITITAAAAINAAGNNTIVMGDAGDTLVLRAIQVGADLRWRVIISDGCALSTVG